MKKYLLIATAAMLLSGCSKEQETPAPQTEDYGYVEFVCAAEALVDETTRATKPLPESCIPASNDFKLTVSNPSGSYNQTYASLSSYDKPYMTAGDYTVTATYGDPDAEGATAYCFEGTTAFTIVARETISATIAPALVNSAIKLTTTEWFNNYYTGASFTVTTESNSFSFPVPSEQMIFVKAGTTLKLKGTATKSQNGVAVSFPEYEIGSTAARTLHTITVDASQAGSDAIHIEFDDTLTEVTPIDVEINPEA